MKEKVEGLLMKLPVLSGKLGMVFAGMFLLFGGVVSAAIVSELADAILSSGNVGEPFSTEITAASVGTITPPNVLDGANTIAGSAAETMDLSITNNANQDISAYLEVACGSADDSLTTDYLSVEFDNVAPQHTCDSANVSYFYRTFAQEAFTAGATETPQVEYGFPITPTGYFTGDYNCAVNVVASKKC